MLDAAAEGRFPPVDGDVEVFEPGDDGHCAIIEFTGHAVVLGDMGRRDLLAMGADGFGGASRPEIKLALAGPGGWIGSQDAVLVARGRDDGSPGTLVRAGSELEEHPRVIRSRKHRSDVEVFVNGGEGGGGLVTIGSGLVGRRELSVELLDGIAHGAARGRALIAAALDLVPRDELVWAQVAPGNAASLRAFLATGFVPIGAETLISPSAAQRV